MISVEDVGKGDVLELVFYSTAMDSDIRVGLDVDMVSVEYEVITGEVLVVKNMPYDALEGVDIRVDVGEDKVQKDDHYGPVIGRSIELNSV